MTKPLFLVVSLISLFACSGTPEIRIDATEPLPRPESVAVSFSRVEVLAVSLPIYAQTEEIHQRDAGGAILPIGMLWADEPARGVTLELVRDLGAITGRLVAPDPWPFRDRSDVRVDVRFDTFLTTQQNTFRIAGQVFIAPENEGLADRAQSFDISSQVFEIESAEAIARARLQAIRDLANFIARKGLR